MTMREISDHDLVVNLRELVSTERKVTLQILQHINELEKRRCYLGLGFATAFDFLTRDLGYSESAAWRRIQAARLIDSVPEASRKVETGEVNLTTLSQAQTAIKAEEKRIGKKLSRERKSLVVATVESSTSRDVERSLISMFPEALSGVVPERDVVRDVTIDHVRAHITLTRTQMEKLERLKEILSHRHFGASLADVIEAAADELLERTDPLRRIVQPRRSSPLVETESRDEGSIVAHSDTGAGVAVRDEITAAKIASIKPSVRNYVFRRDQGRCQFRNEDTGEQCGSKYQIEIDHIFPRAFGGGNEPENLRLLCRQHNLHVAELVFGKAKIDAFRNPYDA